MSNFEKRESETSVRTDPKIISFSLTKQMTQYKGKLSLSPERV